MIILKELHELLDQAKRGEVDLAEQLMLPKVLSWKSWCEENAAEHEVQLDGYVVLSSLTFLKTKHLLPDLPEVIEEEETEEEEDLDIELINQVYLNLRKAKSFLTTKHQRMEPLFTRMGAMVIDEELYDLEEKLKPVPLEKLFEQLTGFLKSQQLPEVAIPSSLPSLEEKMEDLWRRVSTTQEGVSFFALLGKGFQRGAVILCFLAVLELMRLGRVKAYQRDISDEIFLYPISEAA